MSLKNELFALLDLPIDASASTLVDAVRSMRNGFSDLKANTNPVASFEAAQRAQSQLTVFKSLGVTLAVKLLETETQVAALRAANARLQAERDSAASEMVALKSVAREGGDIVALKNMLADQLILRFEETGRIAPFARDQVRQQARQSPELIAKIYGGRQVGSAVPVGLLGINQSGG